MESFFAHRQMSSPSSAGGTNAFQPLFTVFGATPPPSGPAAPGSSLAVEPSGPQVELVEAGGRVTKIVVTCRCCERIELDCEY